MVDVFIDWRVHKIDVRCVAWVEYQQRHNLLHRPVFRGHDLVYGHRGVWGWMTVDSPLELSPLSTDAHSERPQEEINGCG